MSEEKIKKYLDNAKNRLIRLYSSEKDEYQKEFLFKQAQWIEEKVIKNEIITKYKNTNKGDEVQRRRKFVYWTDLGVNVGSEFLGPHFCVVIKEYMKNAVVVPLSSVKENDSDRKSEENGFFKIGCIDGLEEKVDCYAVISQIRTVSKKRLSYYKKNKFEKSLKLKLNDDQLDIIDSAIKSHLLK